MAQRAGALPDPTSAFSCAALELQAGPANRLTRRGGAARPQNGRSEGTRAAAGWEAVQQAKRPHAKMQAERPKGCSEPTTHQTRPSGRNSLHPSRAKRPQPARLPKRTLPRPTPSRMRQPRNLAGSNRLPASNFSKRAADLQSTCSPLLATHMLLNAHRLNPGYQCPTVPRRRPSASTPFYDLQYCALSTSARHPAPADAIEDLAQGTSHVHRNAARRAEEATQERPGRT